MKYVDEFRQPDLAKSLAAAIAREVRSERAYHVMEFCGGHTHAIFRYGVEDLMPANVQFVHGPGCPVCVLPIARIDGAMTLAEKYGVILCTYGDVMRVPASKRKSLMTAKADGADIRMVYSTQDALRLARENPEREVVFFAIGFETTTPPTAVAIKQAEAESLKNFSVYCNHVLTPAAITHVLQSLEESEADAVAIDAFLGPSHVSSVIGSSPYERLASEFRRPIVIAGFEPLDVMQSTLMAIRQLNEGRHEVENQYRRVVTRRGNLKAQALVDDVFELRPNFEWRGLGEVSDSALTIKERFGDFDAERRYLLESRRVLDIKGCDCPAILRGVKKPTDCKLFGTVCTPDNPIGSCMVSSEGACAAYWTYRRFHAPESQRRDAESRRAVGCV
jgi:hydrogenase expression/formation protein HypD